MGLIFKIILKSCRYGLKNGCKIKLYKKAGISGNQIEGRKVGWDQLFRIGFEISVDHKLSINHDVLEEIRLMTGFLNRKAVCHAEEVLVLWSEMVKPSLISRSIF